MVRRFIFSDGTSVRDRLLGLCERSNKEFSRQLHPGIENVLGLRIPDLRLLAKEIAASDWRTYLEAPDHYYMEGRMLHGLVLGYIRTDDTARYLQYVSDFVKCINSWSVCDVFSFATHNRFVRSNRELLWQWLCGWLRSDKEYEVRFGIVQLMKNYIDKDSIDDLLYVLSLVSHTGYYVRMAVAWAISFCMVKYPESTIQWLREGHLDEWTHNKAICKSCESLRVPSELKNDLKGMKR